MLPLLNIVETYHESDVEFPQNDVNESMENQGSAVDGTTTPEIWDFYELRLTKRCRRMELRDRLRIWMKLMVERYRKIGNDEIILVEIYHKVATFASIDGFLKLVLRA